MWSKIVVNIILRVLQGLMLGPSLYYYMLLIFVDSKQVASPRQAKNCLQDLWDLRFTQRFVLYWKMLLTAFSNQRKSTDLSWIYRVTMYAYGL